MFIAQCLGSDFHKYWRLVYRVKSAADSASAYEVEMRASLGGADQCSGGTALASSTNTGSASNAFDNNTTGTYWLSNAPLAGQWLEYQFSVPVGVAEITLKPYFFGSFIYGPAALGVEYSDDRIVWVSAKEFTGLSWAADETKTLALS